ncbi:DNA-3-methyladenine glycosylase family protein [Tundrisphaera sp. TA3]|uniref:DNA-3-methyladenine glycosylase family protein n=1 Tax=Tundrisphaera sp. TA3 TaxID=3435775 RepID=UPI003EBE7D59
MSPARPKRRKNQTPADPREAAVAHLRALDPRWAPILDVVGPCTFEVRPDRFGTLVRAIVGQQISAKAAASIDKRVRDLAGEKHEPAALLALGEEGLRSAGLSGVKARYILNLSRAVEEGAVPLDEVHTWDDDAIIAALTTVKGIGAWTAEMFLIFALGRLDILSVGDLGIRVGLRNFYGLEAMPTPKECRELAEPWRPYRTIAMWYLWQQIDAPRDAKTKAQAEAIAEEESERQIIVADRPKRTQ